jgi:hypothetical protein
VEQLRAALTTFPRARTVALDDSPDEWAGLGEGGAGAVAARGGPGEAPREGDDVECPTISQISSTRRCRQVPSPRSSRVDSHLETTHRASLTGGSSGPCTSCV